MTQIILNILVVIATVMMAIFAYKQHCLEKTNQKISLFDRRLNLYKTLNDFCEDIKDNESLPNKDLVLKTISLAEYDRYLFFGDKALGNYLDEFQKKVGRLTMLIVHELRARKEFENGISSDKNELDEINERKNELVNWFSKQNELMEKLFDDYLRMKK